MIVIENGYCKSYITNINRLKPLQWPYMNMNASQTAGN